VRNESGVAGCDRDRACDVSDNRPVAFRSGITICGHRHRLADHGPRTHPANMFVVSEVEAAAIRAAFERDGELSATVEVRRLFPGITDNAEARECARTIAGWEPLRRRLHSDKGR
jgi:hypothetical protein